MFIILLLFYYFYYCYYKPCVGFADFYYYYYLLFYYFYYCCYYKPCVSLRMYTCTRAEFSSYGCLADMVQLVQRLGKGLVGTSRANILSVLQNVWTENGAYLCSY